MSLGVAEVNTFSDEVHHCLLFVEPWIPQDAVVVEGIADVKGDFEVDVVIQRYVHGCCSLYFHPRSLGGEAGSLFWASWLGCE